ncbi:MAG: hypothetical protein Q9200_003647 [Gallowayella weberi]
MHNQTPPQRSGTPLSNLSPADSFSTVIATLNREATRIHAAMHLQRARDNLVEAIRLQGLNRQIAGTSTTAAVNMVSPPPPPPPSPRSTISPSDENLDPELVDDFAGFGQGKQDWDGEESEWGGRGELGSYEGDGDELARDVEGTFRLWAEEEREEALNPKTGEEVRNPKTGKEKEREWERGDTDQDLGYVNVKVDAVEKDKEA